MGWQLPLGQQALAAALGAHHSVYTTNAIESLNRSLRKVLKTKGSFPTDEPIIKLVYLAMQNIAKKWTMPLRNWGAVINQFSIAFEGRGPL